ncbi:MAG TPA: polysaccharide deacetylase family protein [Polyangia bacterium]|nr:polysaccharide deacetylase family protein [Polyangia bacterium]
MSVGILTLALAASSLAAEPAPALGTLRQQVRRAKPELTSQPTLEDYHQSPYQPSEIVERVHRLESDRAWAELCQELALLPDDELELFEDEIRKPEHQKRLACAPALLVRIASYWKEAERQLATAHPFVPGTLPSVAVLVDTRKDGVFRDGNLPADAIALTFDDGPHPTRTARVLKILADAGIKATFFEIGRNAAAHPEVSRQVLAAGHTVGSHTFSHPNMSQLTEPHAESEVDSGDASVSLALGLKPGQVPFFRFPYGAKTSAEQTFVQKRGNTTFFWNMDSNDWRIRDPHQLFVNVLAELDRAKHGIILFHDIHEQTVIVLPHVLAELRARHLKTVVFVAAPPGTGTPSVTPPWER